MTLSIDEREREFLIELLTSKRDSMLHELHHTDTHEYKELLKTQLGLLENLMTRIGNPRSDATFVAS
ncbi:MAG TPA: hypothetical protein VJ124_12005 [Pyrinomonadaceae bacterium]|nr:hypothetical protein [Pyrinomonadaceae bacterium]